MYESQWKSCADVSNALLGTLAFASAGCLEAPGGGCIALRALTSVSILHGLASADCKPWAAAAEHDTECGAVGCSDAVECVAGLEELVLC